MSRTELAKAVCAWIWEKAGIRAGLNGHYIGKLERGVVRWPGSNYREGLRAVLRVATDAELGFTNSGPVGTTALLDVAAARFQLAAAFAEVETLVRQLDLSSLETRFHDAIRRAWATDAPRWEIATEAGLPMLEIYRIATSTQTDTTFTARDFGSLVRIGATADDAR